MAVIAGVGNVQADLVQARRPFQRQIRQGIAESPGLTRLLEKLQNCRFDTLGLREVDVVALLHAAHSALASVFVREAAEHVVQQSLAHGALGDAHVVERKHVEDLGQDRGASGEYRPTVFRDRVQAQLARMTGIDHVVEDALDARRSDRHRLRIQCPDCLTDCAHGARAACHPFPTSTTERGLHRFELEACGHPRALQALRRYLAVPEKALAE